MNEEQKEKFKGRWLPSIITSLVVTGIVAFFGFYITTKTTTASQSKDIQHIKKDLKEVNQKFTREVNNLESIGKDYREVLKGLSKQNNQISEIQKDINEISKDNNKFYEKFDNMSNRLTRIETMMTLPEQNKVTLPPQGEDGP